MNHARLLCFCVLAIMIPGWALAADPSPVAMPATSPAELANEHLPSWLRISGELRARYEGFLGNRFTDGNDDLYLLQRVRLGVQIRPTPWLTFFAQGQDSRVSFTQRIAPAPPYQDSADLRQAYVQLGQEGSGWFDVKVGRQELAYGEERLLGAGNWGNVARTFDAVRLGFHHGGYRVDTFASSVVVPRDHVFDRHVDGDNLHGVYGQISSWAPKSKIEPFVFWRLSPSAVSESGVNRPLDTKTTGVRWAGELPQKIVYTIEVAAQRGSWGADDMRAWAGFWRIGRQFSRLPLQPAFRLEINHASGDKNPRDGRHGTFDILYPTPHDKYGLADQVGWKNVNHIGFIAETQIRRSLIMQVKVHDWRLDSARDGLYNASGALIVRDATGLSGTHVGEEIDFQAIWTPSKHVAIGGGIGHLFPGQFLKNTTPGHGFTFPYVQLIYGL